MSNKKLRKRLSTFFITYVFVLSSAITSFAAYTGPGSGEITKTGSDTGGLYTMMQNIRTAGISEDATTAEQELLEEVYTAFEDCGATNNSGQFVMKITWEGESRFFTNTTTNAGNSSVDQNYLDLYNTVSSLSQSAGQSQNSSQQSLDEVKSDIKQIANLNMKADITAGTDMLQPFVQPIQQATGFVIAFALILLGLGTALDVAFLIIPFFNSLFTNVAEGGGKMSSQTKSGEVKFRFISDDAMIAYKQAEEEQKSPLGKYLKKRLITYIAAAVVIYLLLSGNINRIILVVLNFLANFIDYFGQSFSAQ